MKNSCLLAEAEIENIKSLPLLQADCRRILLALGIDQVELSAFLASTFQLLLRSLETEKKSNFKLEIVQEGTKTFLNCKISKLSASVLSPFLPDLRKIFAEISLLESSTQDTSILLSFELSKNIDSCYFAEANRPLSAPQEQSTEADALLLALTELQETTAALIQLKARLNHEPEEIARVDRLKTQFLANVSHEIRTPMNAIIGLASMLERSGLNAEQNRYLTLIKDSGNSLLAIINDVLDLSKIEAGKFDLNLKIVQLESLLKTTLQIMQHQAELKGLRLRLHYTVPDEPLSCDPVRLKQILLNLISNAIKFSSQADIDIRVESLGREGRIRQVRFEVIDKGIGIAAEKQGELFSPFVQVDGAKTSKHAGTGLGLSICKRLVEMMSGKIGLESKQGEGSKFWFELPMELAEDKLEATAQLATLTMDSWKPLENCLILLAEDHPINQMVAVSELEDGGAEVDVVSDGAAVCKVWNEKNYDLILLDCQMPIMDGYEAACSLRRLGCNLPIIAMTASAMQGDRQRCLEAGMTDYISKPFAQNELKEIAARYFKGSQPLAAASNQARANTKDQSSKRKELKNSYDPRALEIRFGQNWMRLVTAFIDDLNNRLPNMKSMLEQSDFESLAREAHALVGASGLIFLRELQAGFLELEKSAREKNQQLSASKFATIEKYFSALSQQVIETAKNA